VRLHNVCVKVYSQQPSTVAQRQQLIVESCRTIGSSLGFSGIHSFLFIAVAVAVVAVVVVVTVVVVTVVVVTVAVVVVVTVIVVVVVSYIILRKLSFTRTGL
jgi:Flp pilus assembly protein TadB